MCALIPVIAGAAVLGAGMSAIQGAKNRKVQNRAMAQQEREAARAAQRSEQQFNRANQKEPGIAAMYDRNRRGASGGLGSTFLTGTKGVTNLSSFLGGAPTVLGR